MLLAIDIGNSNIKLGLFQGETMRAAWRVVTNVAHLPDDYGTLLTLMLRARGVGPGQVTGAALCSVVPPLTSVLAEACRAYLGIAPLVVGPGVATGLQVRYETPHALGADRVAAAAGAFHRHGGPVIVVSFGTATVVDAVSARGEYLGGAIAPGVQVAAEALARGASQLQRVELARPKSAIGRTTVAAMQSGILLGYVGLVEGLVRRFKDELAADARVVATGGLAETMAGETDIFTAVEPDLVLEGLAVIHRRQQAAGAEG